MGKLLTTPKPSFHQEGYKLQDTWDFVISSDKQTHSTVNSVLVEERVPGPHILQSASSIVNFHTYYMHIDLWT